MGKSIRWDAELLYLFMGGVGKYVKVVLNGVMSELQFKYDRARMELQGSRLGFNICVVPSSVKLGVLEFTE